MKKIINELIKRGWEEGHECYYKKIGDRTLYYYPEPNTFAFTYDNNSPEEYLGEGSLELLGKILEEFEEEIDL